MTVIGQFETTGVPEHVGVDAHREGKGTFISFSAVGPLSLEARSMLSRWLIANWLSGYYHAKRNNSIIDLESFENNVNKLNNYCYDEKNFKVPIMEAVERILSK